MAEGAYAVRHISDTALWAAYFRAEETKRPDALFREDRISGTSGQANHDNFARECSAQQSAYRYRFGWDQD
jgi:hypothetical protein